MQESQFSNGFTVEGEFVEVIGEGLTKNGSLWVRALIRVLENQYNGEAKYVTIPVFAMRAAGMALKTMKAGTSLIVTGKLSGRSYMDQDNKERFTLDAQAENVVVKVAE